jgi:AAA family ATP:ADP antiporter
MTKRWYKTLLALEPGEFAPSAWSFAYFFCLLCGYYVLRPVRDEMGIQGGVGNLAWVFSATFVVMLAVVPAFGWAVARFSRRRLVVVCYGFFIVNLLVFFALLKLGVAPAWIARAFFVWVSVFNLFVVSLFWSVMNSMFSQAQALRLFGLIAAGGSLGAIVGPGLTTLLVVPLGPINLLPLSAVLLAAAVACRLAVMASQTAESTATARQVARRESVWAGVAHVARSPYLLGICVFIVLYSTLSTFLYFEQAHIVKGAFSSGSQQTQVFAIMDLATNSLTLALQFFATARLVAWLGLPVALALLPVAVAAGFIVLGAAPTLVVLAVFQIIRRAGNYAIAKPAREMLFTVVSPEDKYKAKNFIDTVVYRGGDTASGWLFTGLSALGLGLAAIAFTAVPLAVLWAVFGIILGRARGRHQRADENAHGDSPTRRNTRHDRLATRSR